MLLSLEKQGMKPFYTAVKEADNKTEKAEYTVDASFNGKTLRKMIFFAYYRKSDLKPVSSSFGIANRLFHRFPPFPPF